MSCAVQLTDQSFCQLIVYLRLWTRSVQIARLREESDSLASRVCTYSILFFISPIIKFLADNHFIMEFEFKLWECHQYIIVSICFVFINVITIHININQRLTQRVHKSHLLLITSISRFWLQIFLVFLTMINFETATFYS